MKGCPQWQAQGGQVADDEVDGLTPVVVLAACGGLTPALHLWSFSSRTAFGWSSIRRSTPSKVFTFLTDERGIGVLLDRVLGGMVASQTSERPCSQRAANAEVLDDPQPYGSLRLQPPGGGDTTDIVTGLSDGFRALDHQQRPSVRGSWHQLRDTESLGIPNSTVREHQTWPLSC